MKTWKKPSIKVVYAHKLSELIRVAAYSSSLCPFGNAR